MTDEKRTFESGSNDNINRENVKKEFDTRKENLENDFNQAKTKVESDFNHVKDETTNDFNHAKTKVENDFDHAKTEVKNDFDNLTHHKDSNRTHSNETVDTSNYKRVNTEGDRTHESKDKVTTNRSVRESRNDADKPFYSNWWFWVILLLIIWALWYFFFRTPATI
ncbi:hypothetical protein AB9Q04_05190 [Anaerococcus sp. ENR1011]|uniref:t-SNARE coiled-coil homology domain-containing protein n=1 Tax=Anaerococcus groningensis TaxID=3115616 RepID=A0ABW9N0W8_9FIRM